MKRKFCNRYGDWITGFYCDSCGAPLPDCPYEVMKEFNDKKYDAHLFPEDFKEEEKRGRDHD
jgi:hypothetical protein